MVLLTMLAAGVVGCDRSPSASARISPAAVVVQSPANNPANWMQQNLPTLGRRMLRQLTLPASHDSAMYLSGFLQSLARTQRLSLYGQLMAGIRYFDLRPQDSGGELVTQHGPVSGPTLADVLQDVRRYLKERHRELILLKFSHYQNFSDTSYNAMIQQINRQLGPWLYRSLPSGRRLADIALSDYIRQNAAVVVLCDGPYPLDHPSPGIWVYRDSGSGDPERGDLRVFDQYSNTISFEAMQQDQLAKFDGFKGRCESRPDLRCDLFLLSWTLTPPTAVLPFAQSANSRLAGTMQGVRIPNSYGCTINLLYTDDVESAHLVDVAMSLNRRSGGAGFLALH